MLSPNDEERKTKVTKEEEGGPFDVCVKKYRQGSQSDY